MQGFNKLIPVVEVAGVLEFLHEGLQVFTVNLPHHLDDPLIPQLVDL
jgi:hypothetical protein